MSFDKSFPGILEVLIHCATHKGEKLEMYLTKWHWDLFEFNMAVLHLETWSN